MYWGLSDFVYEVVFLKAFYRNVAMYCIPLVVCQRFPNVAYKLCSFILVLFNFHDDLFNPQCLYLESIVQKYNFST